MKKSQLSHRITWRVIGIILFFNVLTMGVIQAFVLTVSLMNSTMRGQYVIDGIEGKIESMLKVAPQTTANGRAEMEKDLEGVIAEVEQKVSSEFFGQSLQDSDGTIYFSIQITDYKGNRVVGSDSLDVRILKAKQEAVLGTYAMKDLKGTPYYINSKKIADTDWTVIVIQHFQTVFAWGKMLSIVILVFMVIGLIVIFLFTRGSIRRATRPLGFLSESAQEVAKGNFDAPLPTFKHDDEVAQLRDSFGSMQQSLKQFIAELKVSTAAKAALESELNIARDIQLSMVPTEFPSRSDFDIYASMTPAKAVEVIKKYKEEG